ncbi:MAG: hypothetical protein WD187_02375 [Candidatus Woykebacteria bacterium]
MKPISRVLRVVGIGFILSLIATFAVSLKDNSSQPFVPPPKLSIWELISRRFLGGIGTKKDPFERDHKDPVVWGKFREEVSDNELLKLDGEFVEPLLGGILELVLRRGHDDVGVTETAAQHTQRLRELAKAYKELMGFDDRELLELLLMLGVHETPEVMTFDMSRFTPLPTRPAERRRRVKSFKPASIRSERRRVLREWKRERPFVFSLTSGYDDRRRRLILYLYDRFHLGRDRVAVFARQLHYFQPARDIGDQTDDPLIVEWFRKVAFAYLTNERLRGDLAAAYGIEEPVRSDHN